MPSLDAAFPNSTRRATLSRLADGKATVQALAHPLTISQPSVTRRLKVPKGPGPIKTRIDYTSRPRRLNPEVVAQPWDWLGQYRALWEARHVRQDDVLAKLQKEECP